jgi:dTDP-4-dehydrorhamnose 3,5-epimerase
MKIIKTANPDLLIIEPQVFMDERGFFLESYQKEKFVAAGIVHEFVQDNHSSSVRLTLRGIHYQLAHPQGKLVRAVIGEIFDVAVDLRRSSPFFGQWVGALLSADNKRELWIPPGFGHGFLVLSDRADVLYKATDYYDPDSERCIRWDDPDLGINWPIPEGEIPLVSPKDRTGMSFDEVEVFV